MTTEHPSSKTDSQYWGSLEELKGSPEYTDMIGKEFLNPPAKQDVTEMERRDFLKVMGAGMLLTTMACSRRPVEKIIPYVHQPVDVVPGIPNWYTSTCQECATGCGLIVKTREGRPIKLEGNPLHPLNQGALCASGQASILNLYDPDRLKAPVQVDRGQDAFRETSWTEIDSAIGQKLNELKGQGGVYVLTGSLNGPTTLKAIQGFLAAYPGGRHVAFDPTFPEEVARAQELSYGKPLVPRYRFEKAQYILTFGADFLGTWLSPVEFSKRFSKNRNVESGKCSRLVAFEGALSLTGMNADLHVPVRPGDEAMVAFAIANEVAGLTGQGSLGAARGYNAASAAQQTGISAEEIKAIAKELAANRGKSLVLGGGVNAKNGLALQIAVNYLNTILGNDGVTVDSDGAPEAANSSFYNVAQLVASMNRGEVKALLIAGINPVYSLPESLNFEGALSKVPLVISFADRVDETAAFADYVCTTPHYLESWGDANPAAGLYSIVQPTIAPLYDSRPFGESLLKWSGNSTAWYGAVKSYWLESILKGASWEEVLEKGYYSGSASSDAPRASRAFNARSIDQVIQALDPQSDSNYRLALYPSIAMGDGHAANNAWLQELPDPISKITWDNFVSMSPQSAEELGISQGAIVRFKGPKVDFEAPVCIQPGMHPKALMMAVGYGRTRAGRVGNKVGISTRAFQVQNGSDLEWSGQVIDSISKTGKNYRLASTQIHHAMDGRPIVKDASFTEFLQDPKAGNHVEPHIAHGVPTMWPQHEYKGYRWAMAIDTTVCTGCSACVIGCQSENNIPTVGREQVLRGRDMHWLRIDRYYKGDAKAPKVAFQPMLCQHCENAPCETVCPVLATVHDADGLNTMIYNRCVGTRYCSNNCPYKVRRFNYFEYTKNLPEPVNLVLNPDISVREKGVMEKCTFCMQRIRTAKDHAKDEARRVRDGEVKTACQQSCPTDAIVFGDLNDAESQIAKFAKSPRGYRLLEDLNTVPRVTYLTKIRNV